MKGAFFFYPPWGFHHFFLARQFHVSVGNMCMSRDRYNMHMSQHKGGKLNNMSDGIQKDFVTLIEIVLGEQLEKMVVLVLCLQTYIVVLATHNMLY